MSKEEKTKGTWADIALILLLSLVCLVPLVKSFTSRRTTGTKAEISSDESKFVVNLGENKSYTLKGPLGETIVKVENGKLEFLSSACPNKTCTKKRISSVGETIVCLPNRISAVIISPNNTEGGTLPYAPHPNEEVDAVSY